MHALLIKVFVYAVVQCAILKLCRHFAMISFVYNYDLLVLFKVRYIDKKDKKLFIKVTCVTILHPSI